MRRAKAILRSRLVTAAAVGGLALGLAACGQAETGAAGESGEAAQAAGEGGAAQAAGEAGAARTAETPPLEGEEPRGDVGALTPIEERPGEAEDVVEDVAPSQAEAPHVSSGPEDSAAER